MDYNESLRSTVEVRHADEEGWFLSTYTSRYAGRPTFQFGVSSNSELKALALVVARLSGVVEDVRAGLKIGEIVKRNDLDFFNLIDFK